jgi:pimeloyl-ACP methyl ester carboxylesterase
MASLAMAERVLGDSFDLCSVRWYLRIRQESVTPEMLARLLTFWWSTEVRDLLNKVSVPTLVAHYRNNRLTQFEAGRELAAAIPGARSSRWRVTLAFSFLTIRNRCCAR